MQLKNLNGQPEGIDDVMFMRNLFIGRNQDNRRCDSYHEDKNVGQAIAEISLDSVFHVPFDMAADSISA
jgi:hypothetical protein